jgi:hypothetical protein
MCGRRVRWRALLLSVITAGGVRAVRPRSRRRRRIDIALVERDASRAGG